MKIFQIENNMCYYQTPYKTLNQTIGRYPPSITFVEAPDNVFEGWGYINGEFIQPTPPEGWLYDETTGTFYNPAEIAESVRQQRNQLLADTDKTQVLDAPFSKECIAEFKAYRQALRDITEQEGFPYDVVYPEIPEYVKATPDPVDEAFDELVEGTNA